MVWNHLSRLTTSNTWTGTLRIHKRKDSGTNLRSRNRTDGFQSQMVRPLPPSFPRRFDLRTVSCPSARRPIAPVRRLWMPTCSETVRLTRQTFESRIAASAASHSASLCAWKTAGLQQPPCRPRPHTRPLPRRRMDPKAQTVPCRTLTFVILLQSPGL